MCISFNLMQIINAIIFNSLTCVNDYTYLVPLHCAIFIFYDKKHLTMLLHNHIGLQYIICLLRHRCIQFLVIQHV